jgi:hypothetical protein
VRLRRHASEKRKKKQEDIEKVRGPEKRPFGRRAQLQTHKIALSGSPTRVVV